ncbi:hypothetical protein, partial [Proteus mirabilis]|uniref:hypothetical protein n=1 Tax=Proteus mirabilis TaxID=584 RepID=UPI001953C8AF
MSIVGERSAQMAALQRAGIPGGLRGLSPSLYSLQSLLCPMALREVEKQFGSTTLASCKSREEVLPPFLT